MINLNHNIRECIQFKMSINANEKLNLKNIQLLFKNFLY
jgi:hypothetical protein